MKEMIIEQLQQRIGLSKEQAEGAAKVVMDLLEEHGVTLAEGIKDKLGDLGGIGDALGGLVGKE